MKKICFGIVILLLAIVIALCSFGMEALSLTIGIIGFIFALFGLLDPKN